MAGGDLKFPATGLDSFSSVDLANVWNAIISGSASTIAKNQIFTILGTILVGPPSQLLFDLSPINAAFPNGTIMKISTVSCNFALQIPALLPPLGFTFMNVQVPNLVTPLIRGFAQVPTVTANQIIGVEMNPHIKISEFIGDPSQASIFYEHTLTIPDFKQITPIALPTIRMVANTGGSTFSNIQNPLMEVEIEILD